MMDDRTRRSIERMQEIMRTIWIQEYACRSCKSALQQFRASRKFKNVSIRTDHDTAPTTSVLPVIDEDHKTKHRSNMKKLIICYNDGSSTDDSRANAQQQQELHQSSTPVSSDKMKQALDALKSEELEKSEQKPLPKLPLTQQHLDASIHKGKKPSPAMVGVTTPSISAPELQGSELESYMKMHHPQLIKKFNAELQRNMQMARIAPKVLKAKTSKPRRLGVSRNTRKQHKLKAMKDEFICTVCNGSLTKSKVLEHPLMAVSICKRCKAFHGKCLFNKDADGSEWECSWCGDGGEVICCGHCTKVFCRECIEANLGEKELRKALVAEDSWFCYVCNPRPLRLLTRKLNKAKLEDQSTHT